MNCENMQKSNNIKLGYVYSLHLMIDAQCTVLKDILWEK